MGVTERISGDLELIRSEEFAALCRTRPQDLTRHRKLPPNVLAESILARRGTDAVGRARHDVGRDGNRRHEAGIPQGQGEDEAGGAARPLGPPRRAGPRGRRLLHLARHGRRRAGRLVRRRPHDGGDAGGIRRRVGLGQPAGDGRDLDGLRPRHAPDPRRVARPGLPRRSGARSSRTSSRRSASPAGCRCSRSATADTPRSS